MIQNTVLEFNNMNLNVKFWHTFVTCTFCTSKNKDSFKTMEYLGYYYKYKYKIIFKLIFAFDNFCINTCMVRNSKEMKPKTNKDIESIFAQYYLPQIIRSVKIIKLQ